MLKDFNHDLIKQLSEDSSSLHRYDTYLKNAAGCAACQALWQKMKETDEERVRLLTEEIRRHIGANTFA